MKTRQEAAEEYAEGFRTEASQVAARLGFDAGIQTVENTWYENEYPPVSDRFKPDLFSENVLCRTTKHTHEVLAYYDHKKEVWKIYPPVNGTAQELCDLDVNEWRPITWTR